MKISEIYKILDQFSPFELQESWDNSGLLVGDFSSDVKEIALIIDVDDEMLESLNEDTLLLTHHPIIFSGIKQFDYSKYPINLIQKMVKKNISNIAMHTNFDQTHLNIYVAEEILGCKIVQKDDFVVYFEPDENFDDFIIAGLRDLITPYRFNMYKEFEKYIKDETLNEWVRVEYIETLRDMFEADEIELKDTDELFKFILTTNKNEIINAYIISICKDYKLAQHYDDIKQCFLNNKVDLMYDGDLEDCEIAFGLKEERSEERKISGIANDFSEFIEKFDSMEKEFIEQKVNNIKCGRNEPCPCGSGKKYKKCCLNK